MTLVPRSRLVGAIPLAIVVGCAAFGCMGSGVPRSPPPARTTLRFDWGPAFETIEGAPGRGVLQWLALLAEVADLAAPDPVALRAALQDGGASDDSPIGRRLRAAREAAPLSRRRLAGLASIVAARRGGIERTAACFVPEQGGAVEMKVIVVAGLLSRDDDGIALSAEGDARVVVLDALSPVFDGAEEGGERRDAAGEALAARLSSQLFLAGAETFVADRAEWTRPEPFDRLLRAMVLEGIADWIALPEPDRFDSQGRRTPSADVRAREALRHFESNLARLLDPSTAEDERALLRTTLLDGSRDARWGTAACSAMIDAIVRFGASGRVREILVRGPRDLFRAYAEVCSRHAVVPRLTTRTLALAQHAALP